jgi:hypothetical protein
MQLNAQVMGGHTPSSSSGSGTNSQGSAPHMIRALDDKGVLHEAPAGTALPKGWKQQ